MGELIYQIKMCPRCGGKLTRKSEQSSIWKCTGCRIDFTQEVRIAIAQQMRDIAKEAVSAAFEEKIAEHRRALWTELNKPITERSSLEIVTSAQDIRSFSKNDIQANFYLTVIGERRAKPIIDFLKKLAKCDANLYRHHVYDFVRFLSESFEEDFIVPLRTLVSNSFDEGTEEYKACQTLVDKVANDKGVHDVSKKRDVFIACSSKDKEIVWELVQYLESIDREQGSLSCFFYERNLPRGRNADHFYQDRLKDAIKNCTVFLFASSPNSRTKDCDAYSEELSLLNDENSKKFKEEFSQKERVEWILDDVYSRNATPDQKVLGDIKHVFKGTTWHVGTGEQDFEEVYNAIRQCINHSKTRYTVKKEHSTVQKEYAIVPDLETRRTVQTVPSVSATTSESKIHPTTQSGTQTVLYPKSEYGYYSYDKSAKGIGIFVSILLLSIATGVLAIYTSFTINLSQGILILFKVSFALEIIFAIGFGILLYFNQREEWVIPKAVYIVLICICALGALCMVFNERFYVQKVVVDDDYMYEVVGGEYYIYSCDDSVTDIVISELPRNVVGVRGKGLKGNKTLKSVVIDVPDFTILAPAFKGCTNLTDVSFGNGTYEIAQSSFEMCTKLENVTFGNGTCYFGGWIFNGCTKLKNITFNGGDYNFLGGWIFYGCTHLSDIYFNGGSYKNQLFFGINSLWGLNEVTIHDDQAELGTFFSGIFQTVTLVIYPGTKTVGGMRADILVFKEGFDFETDWTDTRVFTRQPIASTICLPSSVSNIPKKILGNNEKTYHVYYQGSKELWQNIPIVDDGSNTNIKSSIVMHYQSQCEYWETNNTEENPSTPSGDTLPTTGTGDYVDNAKNLVELPLWMIIAISVGTIIVLGIASIIIFNECLWDETIWIMWVISILALAAMFFFTAWSWWVISLIEFGVIVISAILSQIIGEYF